MTDLYKAAHLLDGAVVTGITHPDSVRTEWTPEGLSVAPPTRVCVGINACPLVQDCWRYIPAADVLMVGKVGGETIADGDKHTVESYTDVRCWRVDFTTALRSLDSELAKARAACDKAWAAYDKAWAAYDKARAAYDKARAAYGHDRLHADLLATICTPANELHYADGVWT